MVNRNDKDAFPKIHSFHNNNSNNNDDESDVIYKKLAAELDPLLLQFGERRNPIVPIPLRMIPKKERFTKPVLNTIDVFISCLIVTPCVVGCWRGIWNLMEMNSFYFPNVESFLLAIFCHVIFALAQEILHHVFIEKRKKYGRVFTFAFIKIYTELFCVVSNMQWRGMWNWFDYLLGIRLEGAMAKIEDDRLVIACTLAALFLLILIKSLRNVISAPLVLGMDCRDEMFLFSNRFNVSVTESTTLYILDCLFSVLVVGALVVFVWRGVWVLVDFYMFPDDPTLSAWGSLILGYLVVAIAFMLQPTMRYVCDKLTGGARLIAADFYILYSLVGTINVWRGIWNLLDIYFLPENPQLSCWITHWVCLILLILLGCSNSLLVRGVYVDAEEPAGKCVVFPCYYLRIIFQEERLKKLNKLQLNDNSQIRKPTTNNPSVDKAPVENNHHVVTVANTIYNHKEIS